MQAEFWLERWEQNQIGFHEQEINSHLQKYWGKLNLPKLGAPSYLMKYLGLLSPNIHSHTERIG
jgi:hypothetical protein